MFGEGVAFPAAATAALVALCGMSQHALAYTHKVLHVFCANGFPCTDGSEPGSSLVFDPAGNIFGTATSGGTGTNAQGVAFELVNKGHGNWKYKVIHNFCSELDCADGGFPNGLIAGFDGTIYGTTENGGGGSHEGVAFKLTPNAKGTKYKYKKLYDFCSQLNCTDGGIPVSHLSYAGANGGAFYDGVSPLYGITGSGSGTVFELRPGKLWKEKVLYQFCSQTNCSDGGAPMELAADATGSAIYGVTGFGGSGESQGVVYRLTLRSKTWREKVLHDFCEQEPCLDGGAPQSVALGADGRLFGTAFQGGDADQGVAFEVDPDTGQFTRLYSFCAQTDCIDGAHPVGISISGSGELVGTTIDGGDPQRSAGTVFSLKGGDEQVLYAFCHSDGCPDGNLPTGGVATDDLGNLYGATATGGHESSGTIFVLKP